MPTYTDALPATASSKCSGFTWTPDAGSARSGTLVVHTARCTTTYAVGEFACDFDGRAFFLTKTAGGSDPESGRYDVYVGRGAERHCDCKGFAYGRGKPCKHIRACEALIENGWIGTELAPLGERYASPAAPPAPAPRLAPAYAPTCTADLDSW